MPAAAKRFRHDGDVLGEANCFKSLGDIAVAAPITRARASATRRRCRSTRQFGSVLGEANCIESLGDIALERSDHEGARQRYEAALPLYQTVRRRARRGQLHPEPRRHRPSRSDHEGARQRFEAALPLHQKVGDVLGEANCI